VSQFRWQIVPDSGSGNTSMTTAFLETSVIGNWLVSQGKLQTTVIERRVWTKSLKEREAG